METFSFYIPNGVIAEMGLSNDGQTVSREVRLCDLVADGQMSMNEYHALASAGMVFVSIPLFTFKSVEETAYGWICTHLEPEPLAWVHTKEFLQEMFPEAVYCPPPHLPSPRLSPSSVLEELAAMAEEAEATLREIDELIEIYRPR